MTKKKRGPPSLEELLARPWCYYCERDFDDLKVLLSHQKAKHFKCERCGRRLNTAGGLSVHMTQVHKENLDGVENALPNRSGLNVEIFGMEGIPEDIVQQHNQRVITQYHQDVADRQAATGNPPPGSSDSNVAKKPKLEDKSDLKARLAAFKAKKAAGEAGGPSSGSGTPIDPGQAVQSPANTQSPNPYTQPQHQPPAPGGYAPQPFPNQPGPPALPFPQPYSQPPYGAPPLQPPFPSGQQPFYQGPPGFPPTGQHLPPGVSQFPPFPQPPGSQSPQASFGASSPPPQNYPLQRQHIGSPAQNGMFSPPPGLPLAPGLPSRPSFGAPAVNAQQLQQMHNGHYNGHQFNQDSRPLTQENSSAQATKADIDELVGNAAAEANAAKALVNEGAQGSEKKAKKGKDKPTKLVYDDDEISPEEKMAALPQYVFDPSKVPPETVLQSGDAAGASVTGPVVGENDVMDSAG